MGYITAIKKGLYIAGKIDRKYNLNKIFIDKYAPPHWRRPLHKIVDISGSLAGGYGIYNAINSYIAPETPGNDGFSSPWSSPQTRKQNQARRGYPRRKYTRRRKFQYCYQSRRRSSTRKYR